MTDENNWYSDDAATLGDRLVAARSASGLTQEALANKLGVKIVTLDAWENDWKEPRANRLQTLSGLLGVSLRWLLTGVGDGPDNPEDTAEIPTDVNDMLAEMRKLRAQIARSSVKLGELEKRLRKALTIQ
ncbi:transcriptional regulator with XRE-family HTH domain [Loktanella ponticola]|uniref:Transcriptional regulator with XRE-family HTH domain n=1 Tax=Yoonia ponticola TaxID=1524255 RepID=A0A7W9EWN5_9RHOB|nr:helix-turn-helix domain-containing protein [Yoonia ponticola]MBB5720892.1 transcriptional regulator with XRE-family HTH domain [Yoonia ponticola]